jgi:hypothetical protein
MSLIAPGRPGFERRVMVAVAGCVAGTMDREISALLRMRSSLIRQK